MQRIRGSPVKDDVGFGCGKRTRYGNGKWPDGGGIWPDGEGCSPGEGAGCGNEGFGGV